MQIVINIQDDVYKRALVYKEVQLASNRANDLSELIKAVGNGTPLPKGHGRLIDADEFARFLKDVSKWQHYNKLCLDNSLTVADVFDAICADLKGKSICKFEACPTILEADKEVEG